MHKGRCASDPHYPDRVYFRIGVNTLCRSECKLQASLCVFRCRAAQARLDCNGQGNIGYTCASE